MSRLRIANAAKQRDLLRGDRRDEGSRRGRARAAAGSRRGARTSRRGTGSAASPKAWNGSSSKSAPSSFEHDRRGVRVERLDVARRPAPPRSGPPARPRRGAARPRARGSRGPGRRRGSDQSRARSHTVAGVEGGAPPYCGGFHPVEEVPVKRALVAVAVAGVLVAGASPPAPAATKLERQVASLQRQVTSLRKQVTTLKRQVTVTSTCPNVQTLPAVCELALRGGRRGLLRRGDHRGRVPEHLDRDQPGRRQPDLRGAGVAVGPEPVPGCAQRSAPADAGPADDRAVPGDARSTRPAGPRRRSRRRPCSARSGSGARRRAGARAIPQAVG